jgi:CBS domain-containing protein
VGGRHGLAAHDLLQVEDDRAHQLPGSRRDGARAQARGEGLLAAGQDLDSELVRDHLTEDLIAAAPDWSLERAAEAMIAGNFRHLLVVDGGDLCGVLSMRDIVRCWTEQRASAVEGSA